jgi:hypothetical protein
VVAATAAGMAQQVINKLKWVFLDLQTLVVAVVLEISNQAVLAVQALLLFVIGMINYTLFVTREEYQNRYTICKTCEQFNSALALCKECSCFMPVKCKLSEAECPNQKWTTSSNRLTTELADL